MAELSQLQAVINGKGSRLYWSGDKQLLRDFSMTLNQQQRALLKSHLTTVSATREYAQLLQKEVDNARSIR